MAIVFNPVITEQGEQAAFNASANGLELEITHIAFGGGSYDPLGTEQELVNEYVRVAIDSGSRVAPKQIRMTAAWDGDIAGEFPIREIGIYAGDLLFAVFSQADYTIGYKTTGIPFVWFYDFSFSSLPSNSVNIIADANSSMALGAIETHITDADAHPQYAKVADFGYLLSLTWCGIADGNANDIQLNPNPMLGIDNYFAGMRFTFKAASNNLADVTIRVGNHAQIPLLKNGNQPLVADDLRGGNIYEVIYDGQVFNILSGAGVVSADTGTGIDNTISDGGNASSIQTEMIDGGVMSTTTTYDVVDGGMA